MQTRFFLIGMIILVFVLAGGCTSPASGPVIPVQTTMIPPATTMVPTANPPASLLMDMAALDQAYIPVLALTTQNDAVGSRKSMDILLTKWSAFKGTYYSAMPQDSLWKPNLDTVDTTINSANTRITEGNLSAAHAELEQFRLTMLDLRSRNNIDYFIDKLTRFHAPMETIVLAAPPQGNVDVAAIRQAYPDAVAKWSAVKTGTIDATLYGFTPDKMAQIQILMANQTRALDNLGAALDSGNTTMIGTSAVAIKGPFSILFSSFGKFPA
jgi:hypothetical protein